MKLNHRLGKILSLGWLLCGATCCFTSVRALADCPPDEVEVDVRDSRGRERTDNLFWDGEDVKLMARITCTDVLLATRP